jgi:hypothetical protein
MLNFIEATNLGAVNIFVLKKYFSDELPLLRADFLLPLLKIEFNALGFVVVLKFRSVKNPPVRSFRVILARNFRTF